jgi:hypothetical protein
MTNRRWLSATVWLVLYLVTWLGGWLSHGHELRARAQKYGDEGQAENERMTQFAAENGLHHEFCRVFRYTQRSLCQSTPLRS